MTIAERTKHLVVTESSRALRSLPLVVLVLDIALIGVAGLLALWGREQFTVFDATVGVRERLGIVGPLAIVAVIIAIAIAGGYRRDILGSGTDEFKKVLNASLATGGTLGVVCYLAKYDFSRGYFLLAFIIGPSMLLTGRLVLRRVLHAARRRGHLQVRVLVAGTPARIDEVSAVLRRESWLGYGVIGGAAVGTGHRAETATGVPVLGPSDQLVSLAREHSADLIVLTGGVLASAQDMKELAWSLEQQKINVVIAPSVADISQDRLRVRPVGGVPLIHVDHSTWHQAGRIGKRTFDLVGSSLLILALAPVFFFAAVQVWLHDRGPLLFRHHRIGRNGERFECLKFRTMVVDAESLVEQLQKDVGQDALLFKMKEDPRITKPGRWLRRFSIDELPQLFNVFRGDMSLVGPRPQVQKEVDLYRGGMERRLLVRPGMTGLWQVSGRNDLTPEEAMRLDVYYVDNWSMLQDISILFRTVGAVFSSRGAY